MLIPVTVSQQTTPFSSCLLLVNNPTYSRRFLIVGPITTNQSEIVVYATAKVHLTKGRIAYDILRDNDGKKTFAD